MPLRINSEADGASRSRSASHSRLLSGAWCAAAGREALHGLARSDR